MKVKGGKWGKKELNQRERCPLIDVTRTWPAKKKRGGKKTPAPPGGVFTYLRMAAWEIRPM